MDTTTAMVNERKQLESIIENHSLDSKEDAVAFAEAVTKLIWDHKLPGRIYEYYDENIVYQGPSGKRLTNLDDAVLEVLAMQAAFPDMKVHITESFASGDEKTGFKVYQRSYCEGTNKGPSIYGPPNGVKLDEKNSLGQTVYVLKNIQNQWKIVHEYSIRSELTIDKILNNKYGG